MFDGSNSIMPDDTAPRGSSTVGARERNRREISLNSLDVSELKRRSRRVDSGRSTALRGLNVNHRSRSQPVSACFHYHFGACLSAVYLLSKLTVLTLCFALLTFNVVLKVALHV